MSEAVERILGIDWGEARIGLALSDPLGITAQPLPSLQRVGPRRDVAAIAALVEEHHVAVVVVGLPRELSGGEGPSARAARELAERIGRRMPRIRVEMWDERLTSVEAERTLVSGGVRRRKRKQRVDSLAAILILQGYLDARSSVGEEPSE